MSETVKNSNNNKPESYTPKKPEIANMMKELQHESELKLNEIPKSYQLDTVFPTGDNPWVGGCGYLRCFTSMYMHLENMPPSHDTRYWLYRKFLAVTGMGMITTFTNKPDEHNYSYEAAQDYIGRSCRFAGYGYNIFETAGQDKNELFNIIAHSIHLGRPVATIYKDSEAMYKFNHHWCLLIGYDLDNGTLSINEDGTIKACSDWFEKLENIIVITKTGLPRPAITDVLLEIIKDAERSESQGEKYGYAAYEDLIAQLSDDAFFQNADDIMLKNYNEKLESFFWCHAEARGAIGEGYDQLCGQELNGTKYQADISVNGFWGYNGHQTSYIGCMALKKGTDALRDKLHRDIIIHALHMLMSNDSKIINMIKHTLGIKTPDALIPRDINGQPIDYNFRAKAQLGWDNKKAFDEKYFKQMPAVTIESILDHCKIKKKHCIDFNKDIKAVDTKFELAKEGLVLRNNGSEWDVTGRIITKQEFTTPLMIDACIMSGESAALGLFYGDGFIKNGDWKTYLGQL